MPSAIEEVLDTLRAPLEAAGLSIEQDRDEADALADAEIDCVAMQWLGAEIERVDSCRSYLWTAQVGMDAWGKVATGQTVLTKCAALLSTIGQVIQTEQEATSFGGKFHDCVPLSVGDFSEMNGDRGCLSLTLKVQYWTDKADWSAILTD